MLTKPAYLLIKKQPPKSPTETESYSCRIGNLSASALDIKLALEHLRAAISTMTTNVGQPAFYQTDIKPKFDEGTVAIYYLPEGMLRWIITPINDNNTCKHIEGDDVLNQQSLN